MFSPRRNYLSQNAGTRLSLSQRDVLLRAGLKEVAMVLQDIAHGVTYCNGRNFLHLLRPFLPAKP